MKTFSIAFAIACFVLALGTFMFSNKPMAGLALMAIGAIIFLVIGFIVEGDTLVIKHGKGYMNVKGSGNPDFYN